MGVKQQRQLTGGGQRGLRPVALAAVTVTSLLLLYSRPSLIGAQAAPPQATKGVFETCPACRLNAMPELKRFLHESILKKEYGDSLSVNFIPGRTPTLILFGADGKEVSREEVSDKLDYAGLHAWVQGKGFARASSGGSGASNNHGPAAAAAGSQQPAAAATTASTPQATAAGQEQQPAAAAAQGVAAAGAAPLPLQGDEQQLLEQRRRRRRRRMRQQMQQQQMQGGQMHRRRRRRQPVDGV